MAHDDYRSSPRTSAVKFLQAFISNLYRAGSDIPADQFQSWAFQELKGLVPFDAAIWGMGNAARGRFHNVTVVGLPSSFANALEQTREINPFFPVIMKNVGKSFENADIMPDADFYQAEIYRRCFSQFGVERVLSSGHADARSGLYTLLSLYRFDRSRRFADKEKQIFDELAYYLISAYSHVFFLHLTRPKAAPRGRMAAVVDSQAVLHEVQPGFLDLVEKKFTQWQGMNLPFPLRPGEERYTANGLCVSVKPFADLFLVKVWEEGPLDQLTDREREVVFGVCRGLSHKEIGRLIGLAPTTVSSHLYRAYKKLGVESRSALARMVHGAR
jgi:DNA-binding CsgD family transcriptional regulator